MKKNCFVTHYAIEDVFNSTEVAALKDALILLDSVNPKHRTHIEHCPDCTQTLEAHLRCAEHYASLPVP